MDPATTSARPAVPASPLALVTGGAQGLGRAIVDALAALGASVVVNDLMPEAEARAHLAVVPGPGAVVGYWQGDVGQEADVRRMVSGIASSHGPVAILVNNAGTSRPQTIDETSLEDWESILRVNLTSAFLCSREALPGMRTLGWGRIINISSVVAHQGALKGHVHYAASKSGMLGFTRTLARTVAKDGITVNAVAPGVIETDLLKSTHGPTGISEIASGIPLGLGRPRDVALAVAFLCGEGGNYITGSVIDVNGGLYMN